MLEVELAEKFIEKMSECTKYNINIMNMRGEIIASGDNSRVGTFHEIAYTIIQKQLDFVEVNFEEKFLGVRKGINMALKYKNETIGVIGVTGETAEVKPVALVIKKSLETMLEYDVQRNISMERRTAKEQFLNNILYSETEKSEVLKLAQALGYSDGLMRIPIVLSFPCEVELEAPLEKIKTCRSHSKQDISAIVKRDKIVVFMYYHEGIESFFRNYKFVIRDYLSELYLYMEEIGVDFKTYVGTLQDDFTNYRFGYLNCLWLEKNISSSEKNVYFYDYLDTYLKHRLPAIELHQVFRIFSERYTEEFKKMYVKHIGALYNNNYSIMESSKNMFIHKNTLSFRLEKIKNLLGVNPMQSFRDRELLNYFYYYLSEVIVRQ
ncbi:MAG: CdaR family transcriptional regulator [Oscillospiraceae bacterium]